jgi:hypothetical protein
MNWTEQDSYDPNGVSDYDNDSYEEASEDPFGDYERDLFMESAEDYQRFN